MFGLLSRLWAAALVLVLAVTSPLLTAHAVAVAVGQNAPPPSERVIVTFARSTSGRELASAQTDALRHGGRLHFGFTRAVTGFAATLPAAAIAALRGDPRVLSVEPDGVVHATDLPQPASPWNLDRIDQRRLPLDFSRLHASTGAGVTAFIIDTGIRATHHEFGGRVANGFSAIHDGRGTSDCVGHGTHVAATLGGSTYGAAKAVTLVPVRVLDCTGAGSISAVIAGVEWVTTHHHGPAVANMSMGAAASAALDRAVTESIASGVTYVVSAGNGGGDACTASPGRVRGVITVGASTSADRPAPYSNHGRCLDLFAPGSDIVSATNTSDVATDVRSGTSMASPLVAGVVATFLQHSPRALPKAVGRALTKAATGQTLRHLAPGTPNRLLYAPS